MVTTDRPFLYRIIAFTCGFEPPIGAIAPPTNVRRERVGVDGGEPAFSRVDGKLRSRSSKCWSELGIALCFSFATRQCVEPSAKTPATPRKNQITHRCFVSISPTSRRHPMEIEHMSFFFCSHLFRGQAFPRSGEDGVEDFGRPRRDGRLEDGPVYPRWHRQQLLNLGPAAGHQKCEEGGRTLTNLFYPRQPISVD